MIMNSIFDYGALETALAWFRMEYPKLPLFSIGRSVEGRQLYALKLGQGRRRIFFNGAHHGMEWLTAKLLVQFAQELAAGQHQAEALLSACTLYLVPMVNPDGVERSKTVPDWQANARGVDLNHNYDALWQRSKQEEPAYGITGPGPTRFSGLFPESEPESHAVANFTRQNDFAMVLAFHSQGEVIYWDFCGSAPISSTIYGRRFEAVSPYRMEQPDGIASYGGYKDWFIQTFKRPGFTIEIGKGKNPLPLSEFPAIYQRTLPLMLEALRP